MLTLMVRMRRLYRTRGFAWLLGTIALACSSETPSGSSGAAGQATGGGAGQPSGGAGGTGGTAPSFAWTTGAPSPLARFEASGAVVGGELWVMGGFTSSSLTVTRRIDIYDPAADSWRAGPDLPGAETHMAVVAVGSDIVVAGGLGGDFTPDTRTTAAVWRYGAATSTWTPGPDLPTSGAAFAWALVGTNMHVASGLGPDGANDVDVHYVWDTAGAAAWSTAARFPFARNHGGGAASGGVFYAIAGRTRWDEIAGALSFVHAFDPATGAWTTRAPIPSARSEIGASTSTLPDGRIVVVGGALPGIVPSADVLIYDPVSDAWSALVALPEPRKGAVAFAIGRRIIVTTGSPTSTDPVSSTFVGCCL
jgi:N-acetylneuraminic acid mutarotase